MSFANDYVDLHCHPSLKPFGRSFRKKPVGIQGRRRSNRTSLWKYDPPSLFDKLINYAIGLSKFSQANFTSQAYGGVSIVCVSLYPLEKWFVRNSFNNELILDLVANFALGVGDKRIDFIQGIEDYFQDLERQYNFYRQLDGKVVRLPEGKFRYKLVRSYEEINRIKAEDAVKKHSTICIVISIEGLHVLNTGLKKTPNENEVLQNLETIRNWDYKPFFITIAHHFWNHLCGHAESLTGVILKYADQSEGLNTGFSELGLKVMKRLLDNSDGKRIIPDIKHMSPLARQQYYELLGSDQAYNDVPLIVSHGACNGLRSFKNPVVDHPATASTLNPIGINFYDDEIIRIAKSGGIIGLQLDERRIISPEARKKVKHAIRRNKIMHYRSALLWNQIQHIAEVLDKEGMFAWDNIAIGSDFDGIIDALNGFWTAEELPFLADFLERHAFNFTRNNSFELDKNNIPADEIVSRVMSVNAKNFLAKFFTHGLIV